MSCFQNYITPQLLHCSNADFGGHLSVILKFFTAWAYPLKFLKANNKHIDCINRNSILENRSAKDTTDHIPIVLPYLKLNEIINACFNCSDKFTDMLCLPTESTEDDQ